MKFISRRSFLATASVAAAGTLAHNLANAQQPIVLRVSSSMPVDPNSAHYVWFEKFSSAVKAAVGDRIRLDYFPNSQMGKEADIVQQVKVGSADMMISGSSIWATLAPEIGVLDLGYMFDSFDHGGKALDRGVGDQLSKILFERANVSVIGWGFGFGARSVYTKAPVKALADLRGVKLRVLPTPAFIETFQVMNAVPTPIPINELYTALQTGVVDGFEHDPATVLSSKFYEVSKYCFLTEHLFGPVCAVIGKRGLEKIPADLKPAVLKAAADATNYQRGIAAERAKSATQELQGLGMVYTPMPTAERRSVQDAMAKRVWAKFAETYPLSKPIFEAVSEARA